VQGRYIAPLTIVLALLGCANSFEQFYRPTAAAAEIVGKPYMVPLPAVPSLYSHSSDVQADAKRMAEEGYILIGTSSFSGATDKVHESQAIEQGKRVGAAVILMKSQYQGTDTGTMPFTSPGAPQISTVNTMGSFNAHGSSGYTMGNYNATSTVTTQGSPTTYQIPFSIVRNQYFASYWSQEDPNKMRLGARAAPVPDAVRTQLQRNTGIYVPIVVRGTPAYSANILEGDVITRIGDEDVTDPSSFDAQLTRFAGTSVKLTVLRAGIEKEIQVRLNQNP